MASVINQLMNNILRANDVSTPKGSSGDYAHLVFDNKLPVWPEADVGSFLSLSQAMVTVQRGVSVKSSFLAQLPIRILRKVPDPERPGKFKDEDITDNDEFKIFKAYNNFHTHFDFWEAAIGYLEYVGESPWLLMHDDKGALISMFPIRPDLLKIVPHNEFIISHYIYTVNVRDIVIPFEKIFFMKYFNPLNHLRGLSPLASAKNEIILDLLAVNTAKKSLKQGVRTGGLISTKEEIDDDVWKRTQKHIKEEYEGSDNSGKIMFLTHGFDFTQMQLTNEQMQFMEQRRWSADSVATAQGVPKIIYMNFREAGVLANADVQYRLLWDTLLPLGTKISQVVTEFLLPMLTKEENIRFEFDYSGVAALQPDFDKLSERFERGLKNGAVSPNDYREIVLKLDRSPDPAMDRFFMGLNMAPISELGNLNEDEETQEAMLLLHNIASGLDKLNPQTELQKIGSSISDLKQYSIDKELKVEGIKAFSIVAQIQQKVGTPFAKDLSKLFKEQGNEVVSTFTRTNKLLKVEKLKVTASLFNFAKWNIIFKDRGEPHIAEAIRLAGEDLALSLGETWDFDSPDVQTHISTRSSQYALSVNKTTRVSITNILKKGVANNDSIDTIAASLKQYFKEAEGFRAVRIARTEAIASTYFARMEAMKRSPRVENHMWITQRDKDVRESHTSLEGQIVKVGEPFNVPADYKGDSAYPSDINERCLTIPVKVKPKGKE